MSGPRERKDGYDDQLVARLELIWGEGFLSPGGADEIRTLLEGTDVRGMDMLDIGCGTGGGAAALIQEHGAASVIGVDVEQHLVDRAADRAERTGLSTRLTFRTVDLGPFPFDEASFDAVFSKDAILHIPDKPALFSDVFRVLKRDGRFVASDWLKAEGRSRDALEAFLKAIEYSTSMETPATSDRVLESVGFVDV